MTALLAVFDGTGLLAAIGLLVLLGNHLRLLWRSRDFVDPNPALAAPKPADPPAVLVQIPVFEEPEAVAGALAAAAALDWPADRLTIQLLDDSFGPAATLAAAAIQRLGVPVQHLRRTSRDGFKAGALAHGLAHVDAPLVAILDADFRPPPNWLRRATAVLASDPHAGFVQFRFEYANRSRSRLTGLQQMLADTHFLVEQAGRQVAGEPIQFNGTAGVWRREAILAAGGWSGDTVAEDLDLAIRAAVAGWRGRLVLGPPVLAEAVARPGAWRTQQRRWSQGFGQVARTALPRIWRSPWRLGRKLAATLLVGLQAALPCAAAALLALLADMVLRGPGLGHLAVAASAAAILGGGAVLLTWAPYRRLGRGTALDYARLIAGLPVLLFGLAALNSWAVIAGVLGRPLAFARTPKTGAADRP